MQEHQHLSDKEITDLHKEGIGAIRIPNVKDN